MKNENSKIQIPNVNRGYTERTADALLSSLQADIILINAGAGFGKTQALANYVRNSPGKSAWYNISDTDNDLMTFIQNFTKSVQHALGNPGEEFNISVPLLENIDIIMEQLVIWLDEKIDFLNIILDDFQEITNPDIFNLLDILIETMDKKIRLFIVEKRSLPLFFHKYIQSGRAVCIGMEELKFKQEEIARLLTHVGEDAGQCAKLIYDCTEGWPVGIAQIMLQLKQRHKGDTVKVLKDICDKLEVSDYFMTRVYKMLPFDIQTFLTKTAVLDYMTPSICNKAAGIYNSESMLRYLVSEQLFVQTLGEGSSLYRYHSIFQRFLLSQTTPEEQQETLRTAAYFLLKTNDKIQAAEYACRGKASDIVQTVIEVSGDSILEDRLYGTLERWFSLLSDSHCELTPKARFIYGKYLMALGRVTEGNEQIAQAGKAFYEAGQLKDYKQVLLFAAAVKRKAGELLQAEVYLKQAMQDSQPNWDKTAEALLTEQVKIKCCMHQLKEAAGLLLKKTGQGIQFHEDSFLYLAFQLLTMLTQPEEEEPNQAEHASLSQNTNPTPAIQIDCMADGFLLRSCILAEHMKSAYLSGDYETAGQYAQQIIKNSEHETLQTAVAWEMLAVLSWDAGNYRKAVEQSRTGNTFLQKNNIGILDLSSKHRQILTEIHTIRRNTADTRLLISRKAENPGAEPKGNGRIRIQCMDGFSVFLPDKDGREMKWRTKKARELFAYLFHLQGSSVSREALIDLLWPESGMKSAIALFHTTLYSIRQAFTQEGLEELISYENKKYSLNMQLVDSDLAELNAYIQDLAACENNPERMISLYPGSYMGNSGYLWSYGMAKELENQYLTVLRSGAAKRTAQERHEAAIPFYQRILEADPYNEDIVRQLIICLCKSGKQAEAKQQYDRMQKLYREDLELDFTSSFQEIVEHV